MKSLYYIYVILLLFCLSSCSAKKQWISKSKEHNRELSVNRQLHLKTFKGSDTLFKQTIGKLTQVQVWDLRGHVSITPEHLEADRAVIRVWSQQTDATQSAEIRIIKQNEIQDNRLTEFQEHQVETKTQKTIKKKSFPWWWLLLGIVVGGYVLYRWK